MTYTASIPNASDPRAQSQGQILSNYQTINTVWAVNHSQLTGNNPTGKHRVINFISQSGDPTTTATQTALYNKLVTSIPELFFRPRNNGTAIQLTYPSLSTTGQQQYSFVAGPFVVYGGFLFNVTDGQVVTLSPATTLIYVGGNTSGAIAPFTILRQATPTNRVGSSFTIRFQTGITSPIKVFYYFAIGI